MTKLIREPTQKQIDKYKKELPTILLRACKSGFLNTVETIKRCNLIDINHNNEALIMAVKHGHLKIVEYICEDIANIDLNDDNVVPESAKIGNLKMLKLLIKIGFKVSSKTLIASAHGNYLTFKHINKHYHFAQDDYETTYIIAVKKSNVEIVSDLTKQGINIT